MGLIGILLGLTLLIWLALRGWSVLLLAPAAALLAAALAMEPLLASWTQTFMGSAAAFLAPLWQGLGILDEAERLTALGAWGLPHALHLVWADA